MAGIIAKIVPAFLVVASIAAGIFLIGKSALQEKIPGGRASQALNQNPVETLPPAPQTQGKKDIEALFPIKALEKNTSVEKPVGAGNAADNATKALTTKIAESIIKKNPNGPIIKDGQPSIAALDEQGVNQIIQDELKNFDYGKFKPVIKPSSLKISNTNTPLAFEEYLRKSKNILRENFANLKLNPFAPAIADLGLLEQAADKTLKEFYALQAPSALSAWHAEEIALITAEKKIFGSARNMEADPLSSLIAAQAWRRVNQEFDVLSKAVSDFIAKHKLVI